MRLKFQQPFTVILCRLSMSPLTCVNTGQSIKLVQQIATSGEGEIWRTQLPGYLAKIYFAPQPERIRKLEVMIAHPPKDPNAGMNHISFAWPTSLLQARDGSYVGFLMPAIADSVELLNVYNPQRRQKVLPGFNWLYLHTTALNIASIIAAIHQAGYVLGDIKSQNILVNNQALPAIIDTDSFQVRHPDTGELYLCPVGSEGFTPVELLGEDLATVEQTEVHDRFRLAVIIHLLLFGDHPFKGKWVGAGDSPEPTELLRQGWWCYAPNGLIQPSLLTVPLSTVHPVVQDCFLRCFNQGHTDPAARPTAGEWFKALKIATAELTACKSVKQHYYSPSYGRCYWCERATNLGVDIFATSPKRPTSTTSQPRSASRTAAASVVPVLSPRLAAASRSAAAGRSLLTAFKTGFNSGLRSGKLVNPVPATQSLAPPPKRQGFSLLLGNLLAGHFPPLQLPQGWPLVVLAVGSVSGFCGLALFVSRPQMDLGELELTTAGILPLLGLVAICAALIRVNQSTN